MNVVTTKQMQAAEKAADASGLSYDQMMENAGRAVAEAIEAQFDVAGSRVLILAGPGNNGGDGLVVARHLARTGGAVSVYAWKRNTAGDKNWALLESTGVEKILGDDDSHQTRLTTLLDEADIIVDALLGTGVSRPIEGSLAQLLDHARKIITARRKLEEGPLVEPARPALDETVGPVVVAVDVPSGLNSDTGEVDPHTLPADLTVTLAAVKRGHLLMPGLNLVGRLVVGDIGLSAAFYPDDLRLELATAAQVAAMLPARPAGAHKGTFGTATLVAGCLNYIGAAVLSGQAAARVGAGLVRLAPPQPIQGMIASHVVEAIYLPLPHLEGAIAPEAVPVLREKLEDTNALLIGPGLGQAEATADFLQDLLSGKGAKRRNIGFRQAGGEGNDPEPATLPPLVLDADALNILAKQEEWWRLLPPNCILTPHPGEMGRLTGLELKEVQARRLDLAPEMAQKWNQIVLLKGAHTIIAAPDGRTMLMPFANPALAKAGSGDVLAGSIAGLLAQGLEPFAAAVAGAYLHGLAGELARESLGATSVVAGDLLAMLPLAVQEVMGE